MTYIYILLDPVSGAIRYVGKAIDLKARYYRHISCSRDDHKGHWIKQLVAQGARPVLQVVDSLDSGWEERERWWINHLRKEGHPLTNLCEGGEGAPGRPVSEATREKQRQRHQGQVPCEASRKHIADYNRSEQAKAYQREHGRTLVFYRWAKRK